MDVWSSLMGGFATALTPENLLYALIGWLGWAITGAFVFAASAWVLGSRTPVRDIAIGVALSVGTFYGFYVGLNIPIPAGILEGVL